LISISIKLIFTKRKKIARMSMKAYSTSIRCKEKDGTGSKIKGLA
jgi:hypothetical protein